MKRYHTQFVDLEDVYTKVEGSALVAFPVPYE